MGEPISSFPADDILDEIFEDDPSDSETKSNLKNVKIGMVGAGKLAYAIVCGIINFTNIKATNIYVSAKSDRNLLKFKEKGCEVTKRNYDIFTRFDCHIVFLCFPSSVIKQCYRIRCDNKPLPFTVDYIPVPKHKLNILSVVSGVTLDQIVECLINPEELMDFPLAIHRLVLNKSICYGPKAGLCLIDTILEKCDPFVQELLSSISTIEIIPESQMDIMCLFSISGLELSHSFSCGLVEAATNCGHSSGWFLKMPAYAMLTAAQTVLKSEKSPLELIEESTSISSSSFPGLLALKASNFDSILKTTFDVISRRIQDSNESIQ